MLRHRSDVESSCGRIWNAPLQVRHAIALAEDDLSFFSHQYASHEHLGIDIRLHNLLQTVSWSLSSACVSQKRKNNHTMPPVDDLQTVASLSNSKC